MNSYGKLIGTVIACIVLVITGLSPAHAIRCKGQYQVVRGIGEIITPYCQDNYLAYIARKKGYRVSNRQIRLSPNKKEEVCRSIGYDVRVSGICDSLKGGAPNLRRW